MPQILELLISLVVFAALIVGTIFLMTRFKRALVIVCTCFVLMGFVLYAASYFSAGEGLGGAVIAVIRGTLNTLRMFGGNYDGSALSWMARNIWLQILFWICHLSAVILIQAALLSLFGQKLIDGFRLRFGTQREVYIIKGNTSKALVLGRNIATRDSAGQGLDAKRLILFLIEEDSDLKKWQEKASCFNGIAKKLNIKNDILYYIEKTGMGKLSRRKTKYYIVLMQNNMSAPKDVVKITEFAMKKKVDFENIDIFAFTSSEWEREELCLLTQAGENQHHKPLYTIHIISEIDLLMRQIIKEHPPFECSGLAFDNNGLAMRDFTVLIIGFGEVGQSALLRLMMNGQFAGSHMRAIIIDREIECLKEHFLHCYPSLELCCKIEFRNFDARDEKFFKLIKDVDYVDYVVVALSDDELNKQTALDIRLHYERKNMDALPFIAVYERSEGMSCEKQGGKIFSFGCRESIHKESIIIRAEIDRMAKAVNDTYAGLYGGQSWHNLDWVLQESNRAVADFIPAMLRLANTEPGEAAKKDTLTENTELAENLAKTEHLRWMAFHIAMGYRPITTEEMHRRFDLYSSTGNALDYCRRDASARLHACLVPWDELDEVSTTYRLLAQRTGNTKEMKRDFKENDRDVINNIPKFLQTAESEGS